MLHLFVCVCRHEVPGLYYASDVHVFALWAGRVASYLGAVILVLQSTELQQSYVADLIAGCLCFRGLTCFMHLTQLPRNTANLFDLFASENICHAPR